MGPHTMESVPAMTLEDLIHEAGIAYVVTPHPWHLVVIGWKWVCVHGIAVGAIYMRAKGRMGG